MRVLAITCCSLLLFLGAAECLKLHRVPRLGDLLTASLIGAAIGELHHHVRQPLEAAASRNRHPFYLPFEHEPQVPFEPQESAMVPHFHLPSWEEDLFPLASDVLHSVLEHQQHSFHGGLHNYEPFADFSNLEHQWQALSSNPIQTMLHLGMI